jgi:Copper binding proteins, plastocyanin/azurin family
MKLTRLFLLIAAVAVGLLGVATAGYVAHAGSAKTTVNVTEKEYSVTLTPRRVPVGVVRFVVHNKGLYAHALAVKVGTATKRTALIKPGSTATLIVTLKKGMTALWCPVPGHAARGMKATLAVGTAVATTTTTSPTTTTPIPTYTYTTPGY